MKLTLASDKDFEAVRAFYDHVIEHTADIKKHARWIKGLHPDDHSICEYIEQNAMYLLLDGERIAGAMAITMFQTEDYHFVKWKMDASDDEVSVIHILAVNPDYQGTRIEKRMIEEAIRISRAEGKLACRLDALASNLPAHNLYQSKGFVFRGKQHWYAENTGWTDFYLYEYVL